MEAIYGFISNAVGIAVTYPIDVIKQTIKLMQVEVEVVIQLRILLNAFIPRKV